MTIETQITRLDHSVGDFARYVGSLSEGVFLQKLNHWSPRDIVAHLIGWNRAVIEGSKQIVRGQLPFYDVDPGENYSKVNAGFIREYSSSDRQELLDDLQASAGELKGFLQSLDSSEWDRDYGVKHQGSTLTIQETVDELIGDYAHHREQIEKWVKRGG